MKIWHMSTACWIPKATNTHSWYVIVVAFLLQQWLCERASILRYSFIAYHVHFCDILSPICFYTSSTRLAARSNVSVSGRPLAGAIFVCFVLVLCVKHVDFSAKCWSLVQGSPTVYVYVIECNQGNNNPPHLQWLTTRYSILTPWNRELLERLSGFQLVKKFPAFYRTRRLITA